MLCSFQTYGQPMFDTLESWIKGAMVRRARKNKSSGSDTQSVSSMAMTDVEKAENKGEWGVAV